MKQKIFIIQCMQGSLFIRKKYVTLVGSYVITLFYCEVLKLQKSRALQNTFWLDTENKNFIW